MFCNYKKVLISLVYWVLTTQLFAQGNAQTVTITSTGAGSNAAEAKQAALRDALEQAFGAFVTTNTEIFNDQIVKDELSSVASGNIQDYSVLNETPLNDGQWAATVKATVSVSKLISYAQSKGMQVSFNGSLFALNIQQKLLNEQGELRAIENMIKILSNVSKSSFDYSIQVNDPVSLGRENKINSPIIDSKSFYEEERIKQQEQIRNLNTKTNQCCHDQKRGDNSFIKYYSGSQNSADNWKIPIVVTISLKNSFVSLSNYIFKTLQYLNLTQESRQEYEKLGWDTYEVNLKVLQSVESKPNTNSGRKEKLKENFTVFHLRNKKSIELLGSFVVSLRNSFLAFKISEGSKLKSYSDYRVTEVITDNFRPLLLNCWCSRPMCYAPSLFLQNKKLDFEDFYYLPERVSYGNSIDFGITEQFFPEVTWLIRNIGSDVDAKAIPKGLFIQLSNLTDNDKVCLKIKLEDYKNTEEIKNISEYKIISVAENITSVTKAENNYDNSKAIAIGNTEKRKGMMGVKIIELTPAVINDINQNIKVKEKPFEVGLKGLYINEVIPGGAAADIGLKTGDVIIGLNNEDDFTSNNHFEKMKAFMAGDEITLKIIRWQGGIESVKIKLK